MPCKRTLSELATLIPVFTLVAYFFIGQTKGGQAVGQHARQEGRDQEAQVFSEEDIAACAIAAAKLMQHGGNGRALEIIGIAKDEERQKATGGEKDECDC